MVSQYTERLPVGEVHTVLRLLPVFMEQDKQQRLDH